jgi:hypothetical protein
MYQINYNEDKNRAEKLRVVGAKVRAITSNKMGLYGEKWSLAKTIETQVRWIDSMIDDNADRDSIRSAVQRLGTYVSQYQNFS